MAAVQVGTVHAGNLAAAGAPAARRTARLTLIKGDKVVQLTIGSNVMLINGVAVNMDVAAEIGDGRFILVVKSFPVNRIS